MNVFELAARNKFRFPYKGWISTEDLFDLPVTELDLIFKSLNTKAKEAKEESLLSAKSKEDTIIDAKIDIVKYIVESKLEEAEAIAQAAAKKSYDQKIMRIIAKKEDAALENLSVEELKGLLGK